ncbi:MAG: aryl-sulfate sulfotransferase [Deltaproteobacteria bacterium]|nr:aryl-sulfate sulfotransferase [Deltaproteobacteria bacterium]
MLLGLFTLGCEPGDDTASVDFEAEASISDAMPTAMTVRWSTDVPGTSRVEWGTGNHYGERVELAGTRTEHAVAVAGMPGGTAIHWRAISEIDGETVSSGDRVIRTGSMPNDLPVLSVESAEPVGAGRGFVLTNTVGSDTSVILYDRKGNPTWWQRDDNANFMPTQVALSRDGRGILYSSASYDREEELGAIYRVAWTGELLETTVTPNAHHDFLEHEDGTLAYCMMDVREVDGRSIVGDAIVEIPPGGDAATDAVVVWTAWDSLPMTANEVDDSGYYSFGLDWIHCNGLSYNADEGAYFMSSYALKTVMRIDRERGELEWMLGGEASDFELSRAEAFSRAHSPTYRDGTLWIFDNGGQGSASPSRAVAYTLDLSAMTAEQTWSFDADGAYSSVILGDVELVDDGFLVAWGLGGAWQDLDAEGRATWTGSASIGVAAGFAAHVPMAGGPAE